MKSKSEWEKQIRLSADRAVVRTILSADRSVDRTQKKVGHASRSTVPVDCSPCYGRPGSQPSCACARCACRSIERSAGHCWPAFGLPSRSLLDSDLCTISSDELKKLYFNFFLSPLSLHKEATRCFIQTLVTINHSTKELAYRFMRHQKYKKYGF